MGKRIALLVAVATLLVTFQNCSPVNFKNAANGELVGKLDDGGVKPPGSDEQPPIADLPDDDDNDGDDTTQPPKEDKPPVVVDKEPCDNKGPNPPKNPPVVSDLPKSPDSVSPKGPAALCEDARSMFAGTTPSNLNASVITGSGNRVIYANSIKSLDHRGSGHLIVVGSPENTGIDSLRIRGSGDVIVCGMNIDSFFMNGASGELRVIGGNILSDYEVVGSGNVIIYSSGGTLISSN